MYQLSNVEEPATSFASRMGAAFASGWRGFVGALESLAVALAYGWVWLLLLAAVGTVAGRLLWKRRRRERQAASKESENKPQDRTEQTAHPALDALFSCRIFENDVDF